MPKKDTSAAVLGMLSTAGAQTRPVVEPPAPTPPVPATPASAPAAPPAATVRTLPPPAKSAPAEEEIALALTRRGRPLWTTEDFEELLYTLGCAGYGWLRPQAVREALRQMARTPADAAGTR